MLHDEEASRKLITDKLGFYPDGNYPYASLMEEYAEHQASPLEARILALEKALAVAHEAAIHADRKERGRIGNVSGEELYAIFSKAPVEPHPLLAGREVVL